MSKVKNQKPLIEKPASHSKANNTKLLPDAGIFFILLYFLIEFLPAFEGIDVIGAQWLFFTLLNVIVSIFIFFRRHYYNESVKNIFNTYSSLAYLTLVIWALGSYFYAVNSVEVLVNGARLVDTLIAFLNIAVLLSGRRENFIYALHVITFILGYQSLTILKEFYDGFNTGVNFDGLIYGLKGNAGNKNIMAAILAIKIPFALYTVYEGRKLLRVIGFISLLAAIFAIFIINARTAYLSIFGAAFLYIIFLFVNFFKDKKARKKLMISVLFIILPLGIAFFLAQGIVSSARDTSGNTFGTYGTVTERLKSIYVEATSASGNSRIAFWGHAMDYTKHHPIFGGGLGNWKLISIPYVKEITNDLIVPYHAHNDFLEITAELGLIGGLLYISLFVLMLLYTIKIWKSDDENKKFIAVFCLIGLSVYFFDAFLNFPAERPVTQILFAFILASITAVFVSTPKNLLSLKFSVSPLLFTFIAILILIPTTYITFLTYRSMRAQRILASEVNSGSPKASLEVASQIFPPIPNISVTTLPIAGLKSRYYYRDNRFEKALELLDEAAKANPYLYYSEFLRGAFYYVRGEIDSAYKYTKISFYNWPRAENYFRNYMAVLGLKKDTTEMKNAFLNYIKYRNEPSAWNIYLMGILQSKGRGDQYLLALADSALMLFPNHPDILQRKEEIIVSMPAVGESKSMGQLSVEINRLYQEGMQLFQNQSYSDAAARFIKAAGYNPNNYAYFENAGLCYYANKEFKRAINQFNKSLALGTSTSGKSEYFKGVCLLNLGKKEEGCAMVQLAKSKNYPDADIFLKTYCK
jgi:O-antigen ligase/tetratricopeptide (TPR) repeat protein